MKKPEGGLTPLALALIVAFASSAFADEVFFTSGQTLKGLVVEEHVDRLVVSTVDGEQVIWRHDVDQVFFDDPERNYLYLGNEALAAGDFQAALTLYQKAIHMNPAWDDARDALRRLDDRQRRTAGAAERPERVLQDVWGLTLAATESYPVLSAVAPDSAAAQAGLQAGDALVAAWGESLGYRSLAQVAQRVAGPAGTEVKITFQRDVTVLAGAVANAPWPGFGVTMAPEGLTVSEVGVLGAAAGLQVGDLVVALDGRPTRYLPLGQARTAIAKTKTAGLRFQIHRYLLILRPTGSS